MFFFFSLLELPYKKINMTLKIRKKIFLKYN